MGNKTKQLWEYVKEHKVEIMITAGAVALGCVGFRCLNKASRDLFVSANLDDIDFSKPVDITKNIAEDFGVGQLDTVMQYTDGTIEFWLDKMKLEEIGKLGEEIINKIPDIPTNGDVWCLMTVRPTE